MRVEAVEEGPPILPAPLAFAALFVGYNSVRDGFEEG
jgi:hypothetical protein